MAVLRKQTGEIVAKAVMVKVMQSLIQFFEVGKSMNDFQVNETIDLILKEFYFLKLEDFKVCFDRIKTGFYGQLYDRMDGQIIMLYLRQYCEERINTSEALNSEKHKEVLSLEEGDKKYLIGVGENFLRANNNGYEEVGHKDLATWFGYDEALKIKAWVIKNHYQHSPDSVKITKGNKTDIGKLVKEDAKPKDPLRQFNIAMHKIEVDPNLTELDRANARRKAVGLLPLSADEHEKYLKIQSKTTF